MQINAQHFIPFDYRGKIHGAVHRNHGTARSVSCINRNHVCTTRTQFKSYISSQLAWYCWKYWIRVCTLLLSVELGALIGSQLVSQRDRKICFFSHRSYDWCSYNKAISFHIKISWRNVKIIKNFSMTRLQW